MADDGGIGRFKKRLAAIPQAVKAATQPALLKQANAMATTMRTFAPEETGALKRSIEVTPGGQSTPAYSQPGGSMTVADNAVAVTAGNAEVRYAHLVEYGHKASGFSTRGSPAAPFFWPAVRLHNRKALAAVKRAVGKAVRENWGKP